MIPTRLYLLSKKIHRFLMAIIAVIGTLMSVTGILLKYPFFTAKFNFVDLSQVRFIHSNLSPIFAMTFILMAITGITMYLFPLIRKK